MYQLNGQLRVSSLTLIEILVNSGYIIKDDETSVIIEYKREIKSITKNKVIDYLKERSKPYIYYKNQLKEIVPNISNKYFNMLETDKFNSTQEILDRLVYYKAIHFLVRDSQNVQVLVKEYLRNNEETIKD